MIPLRQAGIQLRLHWRSERRNPRPLYWLWSGTHPLRKWILDQLAAELSLPLLMLYAPTGELACGPHDAIPHLLRHGGIIAWGGEADQSWLDTLQGVIDASTDHQHATVLIVALPGPRVGRRLSPDRMLQLTWPAPSASDLAEWLLTGLPRGTGGDPREVWDVPLNRAIAVRAAATWLAWDHLAEQVAGVVSPEPHEWLRWIWMSLAPLDPDQVWEQWQVALPPDLDRETRERFHELVSLWVEPLRGSMPELEDFDGS